MKKYTVSVHGMVTSGETKLPIAGAEVRVGAKRDNAMVGYAPTSTDKAGRYCVQLEWEEHDKVDLVIDARAVGHGTGLWPWMAIKDRDEMRQAGTISAGDERQADIELPPGFALDVLVEDENGEPLPGASSVVICTSREAQYCYWPLHYHVYGPEGYDPKSNDAGHLLWKGFGALQTGERFVVSVQHEDYAEHLLQSPELLPRENGLATATVRMSRGVVLTGVVTDRKGKPVENASVNAVLTDKDSLVPVCHQVSRTVRSDGEGNYRFGSLSPGEYVITAKHDELAQTVVPEVQLAETGGSLNVRLAPGASVTGTVLDRDGKPLPGVSLGASWIKPEYGRKSTTTDEQGAFKLDGLPSRHGYTIEAHSPNRMQFYGFARLRGSMQGLVFDERELVTVKGQLLDPTTGAPLEASVNVTAWSGKPIAFMGYTQGTERDGRFEISVPPAAKWLSVNSNYTAYALIEGDFKAGDVNEYPKLTALPGAEILVHVVDDATGERIPGAQVRIDTQRVWNSVSRHDTDEKGESRHTNMPPGKGSVQVVHPDYERVRQGPLKLDSRRAREVTVRLKRKCDTPAAQ